MTQITKTDMRARVFCLILALALAFGLAGTALQAVGVDVNPMGVITSKADVFDEIVDADGTIKLNQNATEAEQKQTLAKVVSQYRTIASVITGILAVTMFIFMLVQFTKLGAAGDNEQSRKRAIAGILTTGIATALLGGASVVIGFFWNILATV